MIPIILPNYMYSSTYDIYLENFNDAELVGCALWILKQSLNYENYDQNNYVRGFITNGSEWKLLEIKETLVKKTMILKPFDDKVKLIKGFKPTIIDDLKLMDKIIGLIRFALNIEDNIILRSASYKLSDSSEYQLIKNKDVIQQTEDKIPYIVEPNKSPQLTQKRINLLK